ncbi:MAG: hypothetical protein ACHQFX_20425, partial [Chitinophagales bacterium]
MRIKTFPVAALLICVNAFVSKAQDMPPTMSLVYPGIDGKLVYTSDSLGNKIPDFSNAGYKGGGVAIPYVPVKVTIWPVAGDNSDKVQKAIDSVSALPPDAYGLRGAVLLKMGLYQLDKPLYIRASGVVLRGEGMSDIGTILFGKIPKQQPAQGPGRGGRPALVNIIGDSAIIVQEETKQLITDNYVPVGANSFNVVSGKIFKKGDRILVRRKGNEDWIKEIGQDSATAGRNRWRPFVITYDRVIADIKGNTIT